MKIRVYYEDTDAAGIVYYANYLKFCERARSEVFFAAGMSPQSEAGYFVVRALEAKYLQSARLGDLLTVETVLTQKKRTSITLLQRVLKAGEALFEMRIVLAFLKDGRPVRIPEEVYALLAPFEGKTVE